jgi:uroporphyrinogen decarboxylase
VASTGALPVSARGSRAASAVPNQPVPRYNLGWTHSRRHRVTPRERVKAAVEHREPDTVPLGEWIIDYGPASLVLGRPTLLRGKALLAHALWEGRRDEIVESSKRDMVELVRRLDLDMACVDLAWPRNATYEAPERIDAETWRDRHGNVFRYSELARDLMLLEEGTGSWQPPRPDRWVDDELRPDLSELEIIEHVLAEPGQTHFIFARAGDAGLPIFSAQCVERQMLQLAEDTAVAGRDPRPASSQPDQGA